MKSYLLPTVLAVLLMAFIRKKRLEKGAAMLRLQGRVWRPPQRVSDQRRGLLVAVPLPRHSFTWLLKGYDNEKTTQIYLASLEISVVDKANYLVISLI